MFVDEIPVAAEASAEFTPVLVLAIAPPGAEFVDSMEATLSSTLPIGEIRYTLDGSEPVFDSMLYTDPLRIIETSTIRARIFINNMPVSEIVEATFTKTSVLSISPSGGLFIESVEVMLAVTIEIAKIRFTLDGSEPTKNSMLYSESFTLTETAEVRARDLCSAGGQLTGRAHRSRSGRSAGRGAQLLSVVPS